MSRILRHSAVYIRHNSRMRMRGFSSLLIARCAPVARTGEYIGRVFPRRGCGHRRDRGDGQDGRAGPGRSRQVQAGPSRPFQASFIAPRHRCLASGEVQWLRAEVPSFDVLRAPPPSFGVGGVWGVILGRGY